MKKANQGRKPADTNVYVCDFCGAVNVATPICGCADSRKANGRELPAVNLNTTTLTW